VVDVGEVIVIEPRVKDCNRCKGSGTVAIGKKGKAVDRHLICSCPAGRSLASSLFVSREYFEMRNAGQIDTMPEAAYG
jgi:hypothetical protein